MYILLSIRSFDEQYHNLNMFNLSPNITEYLEQLGFKKCGDDIKIKCFDSTEKFYATPSSSKGKTSND